MEAQPLFHLAFPVIDLDTTRNFYQSILGCSVGRESERWIDFEFFGHQLVAHLIPGSRKTGAVTNPVDGDNVPSFHFGPILEWDDLQSLIERLKAHNVEFVIEPRTRFEGRKGEQMTLFIKDPSGNHLEFKSFRDMSMLFAKDLEAYA